MTGVERKTIVIHQALATAELPHAIGGAIALAYCTLDPRGTIDIDIDVFVPASRCDEVLSVLPEGVVWNRPDRDELLERAQVRLYWDDTAVDLFLTDHPFHYEVQTRCREAPLGGVMLPVLSCTDLLIFKVLSGRTKDWADIESMADADSIDIPYALTRLEYWLGPESPVCRRLAAIGEGKRGDVAWGASRLLAPKLPRDDR